MGKIPRILKSGRHDRAFYDHLWQTIRFGKVWSGEMINRRKDGSVYFEDQTITPVRDHRSEVSPSWPSSKTSPSACRWKSSSASVSWWAALSGVVGNCSQVV